MVVRYLITCVLCLAWTGVFSQFEKNYIPSPVQDTIPTATYQSLQAKLTLDKSRVTEAKSQINTYLKELYTKRTDFVIEQFNNDYFIVDENLSPYLQSILENIYTANPSLPREAKVYAFRSDAVNAMSYGEGTIAFTLGLLSRMETEAQIAYVLCHELAHYHSRHSDIKMTKFARLNYDKQLKRQVKAISKSEYGQYTKFTQLMRSLDISITRHSRENEFEADSIALLYYLNTTYDTHAPIRTLQILDSADVSPYQKNIDLKKYFDFENYRFKEHWISYTPSTTWHASAENDSLHTHPSCARRIIALQRQLKLQKQKDQQPAKTNAMRTRSEFEQAASAFHFKSYGKALFKSMILSERYPDNAYAHAMIGQSLYQLYLHQKNHELGKVLALPDPRFDENYDRVLSFLHALRLLELASLAYQYISTKKETFSTSEDFIYARWLSSHTEVSQDDPAKIKSEYIARFPAGKYIALMR
jgi:predicted Zn-dependent protease